MTIEEIMAGAAEAVTKGATRRELKWKPVAQTLDDVTSEPKLMIYGPSGSGKTHLLLGPLLCGENLLVRNVDFGGSGLITIQHALAAVGRQDLLSRVYAVTLPTYDHYFDSFDNPLDYFPRLDPGHEKRFTPTVSVLEGISGLQLNAIDPHIHGEELDAEDRWGYYRKLKNATLRAFHEFLTERWSGPLDDTDKPSWELPDCARIMTGLESGEVKIRDKKLGDITKRVVAGTEYEGKRGVYISGAAGTLLEPAFDLIIGCFVDDGTFLEPKPREYKYRCQLGGAALGKQRGYGLPEIMVADPVMVWKKIRGLS